MASVIYADKCPQCGGICIVNSYYRKGQMSAFCERCGWSYYKDGDCEEEKQGYGVSHVTYKGGIADIFGIHKPPNENEDDPTDPDIDINISINSCGIDCNCFNNTASTQKETN